MPTVDVARLVVGAVCALVLAWAAPAQATWSIVAVDSRTREVGSAGASCTPYVVGIVSLVPGRGAIVAQAMSNAAARRRGAELLGRGGAPGAVVAAISHPSFDERFQEQQYGVASLDFFERPSAFTGRRTPAAAGQLLAPGVAVVGNVLTGQGVLTATMATFLRLADVPLAERLLSALEAGAAAGGDRRCGAQRAQSAYLVVARPDDAPRRPAVRHIIPGQREGGPNPVHLLRKGFGPGRVD